MNQVTPELDDIPDGRIDISIMTKQELITLRDDITEEIQLFDLTEARREKLRRIFREERQKLQERLELEEQEIRDRLKKQTKVISYNDDSSDSDKIKPKKGRPPLKKKK
jgi:hypothetical protein